MPLKKILTRIDLFLFLFTILSCNNNNTSSSNSATSDSNYTKGTYAYDAAFLKKSLSGVIELEDETGNAKILLAADYQGRVMSSTAAGDSGVSFGWINYQLIESNQKKAQFNPVGGEERFW